MQFDPNPIRCETPYLCEIPGGYSIGQVVWSKINYEQDAKPLRIGDRGVVRGPAESLPDRVLVEFDGVAGSSYMLLSDIAVTKPDV